MGGNPDLYNGSLDVSITAKILKPLYKVNTTQVYIPKRHTLLQLMRTPNSSPPIHAYSRMIWYAIRYVYGVHIDCLILFPGKIHYMHKQITKEFEGRKYLYECTPFGYVNL